MSISGALGLIITGRPGWAGCSAGGHWVKAWHRRLADRVAAVETNSKWVQETIAMHRGLLVDLGGHAWGWRWDEAFHQSSSFKICNAAATKHLSKQQQIWTIILCFSSAVTKRHGERSWAPGGILAAAAAVTTSEADLKEREQSGILRARCMLKMIDWGTRK